eukprot:294459-Lingulodinium_polyedra.AAC.1
MCSSPTTPSPTRVVGRRPADIQENSDEPPTAALAIPTRVPRSEAVGRLLFASRPAKPLRDPLLPLPFVIDAVFWR